MVFKGNKLNSLQQKSVDLFIFVRLGTNYIYILIGCSQIFMERALSFFIEPESRDLKMYEMQGLLFLEFKSKIKLGDQLI